MPAAPFGDIDALLREVPLACAIRADLSTAQLVVDRARTPRGGQGEPDSRQLGVALSRIGFGY